MGATAVGWNDKLAITELLQQASGFARSWSTSLSQYKPVKTCCLLVEHKELQFCACILLLGLSYASVVASLRFVLYAGAAVFVVLRMAAKGLTAHYFFTWG